MPLLQVALLAFFLLVAVLHFMYSWWLLFVCFCTGQAPPLYHGSLHHHAFSTVHGLHLSHAPALALQQQHCTGVNS